MMFSMQLIFFLSFSQQLFSLKNGEIHVWGRFKRILAFIRMSGLFLKHEHVLKLRHESWLSLLSPHI